MMWTKAVFLCISTCDATGGGLIALGTSQPLPGAPRTSSHARRWAARATCAAHRVAHYRGGPCEPSKPMAVAFIPAAERAALGVVASDALRVVAPGYVLGTWEQLAPLAARRHAASGTTTTINVVWGYAGWGKTQILAEIARGGWGLVELSEFESRRPDALLDIEWELDHEWSRIVALAKCAPRSEYWRRGG